MKPHTVFVLLVTLFFMHVAVAQNSVRNPEALLRQMQEQFYKVKDYKALVNIKVNISFINIPERQATLYYKQPNKMHVDTRGFTLLPRRGMNNAGMEVLNEAHTALNAGTEEVRGVDTKVLKVIPQTQDDSIVLTQFWVDPGRAVPMRVETFTKTKGSFTVDFYYANHPYNLPDKLVVSFSMKEKKFPAAFTGNYEDIGEKLSKKKKNARGEVIVDYSNYEVNQGLSDELFKN